MNPLQRFGALRESPKSPTGLRELWEALRTYPRSYQDNPKDAPPSLAKLLKMGASLQDLVKIWQMIRAVVDPNVITDGFFLKEFASWWNHLDRLKDPQFPDYWLFNFSKDLYAEYMTLAQQLAMKHNHGVLPLPEWRHYTPILGLDPFELQEYFLWLGPVYDTLPNEYKQKLEVARNLISEDDVWHIRGPDANHANQYNQFLLYEKLAPTNPETGFKDIEAVDKDFLLRHIYYK